jgi:hypothetical protein
LVEGFEAVGGVLLGWALTDGAADTVVTVVAVTVTWELGVSELPQATTSNNIPPSEPTANHFCAAIPLPLRVN